MAVHRCPTKTFSEKFLAETDLRLLQHPRSLCVNVAVVLDLSLTRSLTPTTDPVFNNATGS